MYLGALNKAEAPPGSVVHFSVMAPTLDALEGEWEWGGTRDT